MNPTVGSLFAGIGGFDLGFQRAGFDVTWQVEIDPWCRKVLAKNFRDAERHEDVRRVGIHNLARVDVMCGGFPCQDISVAGDGAGIEEGTRSGLWIEFARIIGELRPKFVLVENVAALLFRGMGRVLGDLSEIGYDAEWDVISAADLGLPHLRERVWILAYPRESYLRHTASERFSEARGVRHRQSSQRVSRVGEESVFADARRERTKRFFSEEVSRLGGLSWCKDVRRVEDLRGRSDIPEPLIRGASNGIPHWVDRVGGIGNAVVPQIPELYARRIKQLLVYQQKVKQ